MADDQPMITDRGFAHWPPITTVRHDELQVYESSSAEELAVWLSVNGEAVHLTYLEALALVTRAELRAALETEAPDG